MQHAAQEPTLVGGQAGLRQSGCTENPGWEDLPGGGVSEAPRPMGFAEEGAWWKFPPGTEEIYAS